MVAGEQVRSGNGWTALGTTTGSVRQKVATCSLGYVTYADWREPVRRLRATTGPATEELLRVAVALGCPHEAEPHGVLCAIVEDWLRPVLYGESSPLATERQLAYLASLGDTNVEPGMHRPVASAWIDHYLALGSAQALECLELVSGDQVHLKNDYIDPGTGEITDLGGTFTVSSIGSNGLVYFRGGNGKCAWPTKLLPIRES